VRYGVLGPLEVRDAAGAPVPLGSAKLRILLSLLLADAGRVVPVDRIVDELWGEAPPASATGTLQSYVSHLRRLLGADAIVTRAPGYLVAAGETDLDLLRLPALVDEAAAAPDPVRAEQLLAEATGLWRGDPLPDLGPAADAQRARLVELDLTAREQLAGIRTRLGRPGRAVADLEPLVAAHPLREQLWAGLVEALYAAGRQADALEAYRSCARLLRDELGIDPGPRLRELERQVLRQELAQPAPDPTPAPTIVGRVEERDRVRAALAEVTRGSGAVLVLEGEAGIGKTRLAEAATAIAAAQGWRSAWSRCADDAGAPTLWPWTRLLDQLGAPELRTEGTGDPDRSRFALFQDLRERLRAAGAQAPLLVVLDDVQAADATSLQLLTLLARHLDGMRLLVVLTVRTVGEPLRDEVTETLAALAREPRVQRIRLGGLSAPDVRELLTAYYPDLVDRLAAQVHERTDGNPFYVVELARLLRSEEAGPLPPSVRDVIERRLDQLPADTVELLRLAAVAGRDVDLPLLEALAERSGEDVVTALEPAVRSGLLLADDVTWEWRFNHALVQETLVAGLSRVAAARLHARLATALAADPAADVDRLAHHAFAAVPVLGAGPARDYATAAAAAARSRLAYTDAAAHTRRALSLLGGRGDPRQRHALLVDLADDLLRAGDPGQARAATAEALELARALGDDDLAAQAASVWGSVTLWNWRNYGQVDEDLVALLERLEARADPLLRSQLLGALGVELAYGPRKADGVAYATRAVEIARGLADPVQLGRALNNLFIAGWAPDEPGRLRLRATDEALALRGLPARTEFFARLHRGPLRLHYGDAAGFAEDLAAARRLAGGLTGPEVLPQVMLEEAGLAELHGDWDAAEALGTEAVAMYGEAALWGARFCLACIVYTVARARGRVGDALATLVDAADLDVPLVHDLAVLTAAESGDRAEALRLRRRFPARTPDDWTTDALLVVRGQLALALEGDVAAAYADLVPYAGRQVVIGTAGGVWGAYDGVLERLARALGDTAAADAYRTAYVAAADRLGSPWQKESGCL
jgi:DNA-binding SARP family transcriptional activator